MGNSDNQTLTTMERKIFELLSGDIHLTKEQIAWREGISASTLYRTLNHVAEKFGFYRFVEDLIEPILEIDREQRRIALEKEQELLQQEIKQQEEIQRLQQRKQQLVSENVQIQGELSRLNGFTKRETEVFNLFANVHGTELSNMEMANLLGIKEGTLKKHLQNIYRKLGVKNRASVAALAVKTKYQQQSQTEQGE